MGKTVAKIIAFVLVAVLAVSGIALILRYTNGGTEEFKTFYVEYGGKKILASESSMKLRTGEEHRFDVRYTFDFVTEEIRDYSVKVVANVEKGKEIPYTADGKDMLYSDGQDLTAAFDIEHEETYFVLELPEEISLKTVLQSLASNKGKAIEVDEKIEETAPYLYTLVVSSDNGSTVININFAFLTPVHGIELDRDHIAFGVNGGTPPKDDGDDSVTEDEESRAYAITYEIAYSYADTPIQTECPSQARAGEIVTLTAVPDVRYEDYGVWAEVYDRASGEYMYTAQTVSYGCITFEMPECDVLIKIYHV